MQLEAQNTKLAVMFNNEGSAWLLYKRCLSVNCHTMIHITSTQIVLCTIRCMQLEWDCIMKTIRCYYYYYNQSGRSSRSFSANQPRKMKLRIQNLHVTFVLFVLHLRFLCWLFKNMKFKACGFVFESIHFVQICRNRGNVNQQHWSFINRVL